MNSYRAYFRRFPKEEMQELTAQLNRARVTKNKVRVIELEKGIRRLW